MKELLKFSGAVALVGIAFGLSACKLGRDEEEATAAHWGEGNENEELFPENAKKSAENALSTVKTEARSERAQTLEKFFREGNYAEAVEMAEDLRELSEEASEERDVADFIYGVSLYYLGRHDEAQPVLEAHGKTFPQSRHRESSLYYRGSNLVKRQRYREASQVLDAFLAVFRESMLMEYALYDRAVCHYELGEFDKALETVERIEKEFVYSKIRDRALAMKGDVLLEGRNFNRAEVAYVEAAESAKNFNHPKTMARSVAGLIAVASERKDWKSSAEYYDTFFTHFSKSPEAVSAARAGLPAMNATGRLAEGLMNLENSLLLLPPSAKASTMNAALKEYAKYYRDEHGPEKLLRNFDNMSGRTKGSKRLREQIVIARLEVLEDNFPERTAEIGVFYEEIRKHFDRNDLSPETMVKLGRHVAKSNSEEGIEILENVLMRPGSQFKDVATLELAKIFAQSPETDVQHLAIVNFKKVLDSYGRPELAEEATLGLARLYTRQQDWANAFYYWKAYDANPEWTLAKAEAAQQMEIAQAKAGPLPAVPEKTQPVIVVDVPEPVKSRFDIAFNSANSKVEEGDKREAFEELTELIEQADKLENLTKADERVLRRANILHQDLAVELGMGAILNEE